MLGFHLQSAILNMKCYVFFTCGDTAGALPYPVIFSVLALLEITILSLLQLGKVVRLSPANKITCVLFPS